MSRRLLTCFAALVALPAAVALGATASAPIVLPYSAAVLAPAAKSNAAVVAAADATRCEVRVYRRGGATTVEGVVFATAPISGSYRMSVNGAAKGGTDNDQSGSFAATPGGATSLGSVAVGAGDYAVEMTVRWKGGSTTCAQHVGKG